MTMYVLLMGLFVLFDVPLTVASVASELGLPGISINAASLSSNKYSMKQKFHRDGVIFHGFPCSIS